MSNMDRYGLLGIPAAFIKYCKSQKDCASCPVARAKAEAFRLKAEGSVWQTCVGAFADMENRS